MLEAFDRHMDRLDSEDALTQILLYSNDPNDYTFTMMPGNFWDWVVPGRLVERLSRTDARNLLRLRVFEHSWEDVGWADWMQ